MKLSKHIKFELNERQEHVINNWLNANWTEEQMSEMCEEDACCTSPLTFEFTSSGLGDIVVVRCGRRRLDISIDDDNEFGDEARKYERCYDRR